MKNNKGEKSEETDAKQLKKTIESLEAANEKLETEKEELSAKVKDTVALEAKVKESTAALGAAKEALSEQAEMIAKQNFALMKITSTPNPQATVIKKIPGKTLADMKLILYASHRFVEVNLPGKDEEEMKAFNEKIAPGAVVRCTFETMQPFEVAEVTEALGQVHRVNKVVGEYSEIEHENGFRLISNGVHKVEIGDRVVLDPEGVIIRRNLGKEAVRFNFEAESVVSWDDVGGLGHAREALIEMVELPYRYKEVYAKYGKKAAKGILLYGPPGCGKTLLGKATATALAKIHGQRVSSGFLYVKGPEILSKWVGESEAIIRTIFEQCRRHKRAHGYPAVVFVDEADAILGKRGRGISSDMEKTIVPMFLAEMDGLDESSAIVILATNRADVLDQAVIRDGRVDRKVRIDRPNEKTSVDIFHIHLGSKPLADDIPVNEVATSAAANLFDPNRALYQIERKSGEPMTVTLGTIVSGAMIAAVVEQATSFALKNDIETDKFCGLKKEHMSAAIDRLYQEHKAMPHEAEIEDLTAEWKNEIRNVRKIKS